MKILNQEAVLIISGNLCLWILLLLPYMLTYANPIHLLLQPFMALPYFILAMSIYLIAKLRKLR